MAEVAVLAALKVLGTTFAKEVASLATSKISEVSSTYANLEANMNNISSELLVMQGFLYEIEIDNPSNECQVAWLKEVQKLAYHIEDIVVEFSYLIGTQKFGGITFFVKKLFIDPKSLVDFKRLASQLLEAERSLKHLTRMRQRWLPTMDIRNGNNSNFLNQDSNNEAVKAHFVDEHHLVGIEENRQKLTKWLKAREPQLYVISVWGMGGVGKTTLATNVFNREKNNFHCNAWINVSQSYSTANLLRNIITELSKESKNNPTNTSSMDLRELKESTRDLLRGKYLICLDDMWDPKAFKDIEDTLIDNNLGSRIMITSRIAQVANLARESHRLELKPLSKEESWDLFCRNAFHIVGRRSGQEKSGPIMESSNHHYPSFLEKWAGAIVSTLDLTTAKRSISDLLCRKPSRIEGNHECPPPLEKWARQIVLKCDGLPLALCSVGILLSSYEKTESEWRRIHDQLTWSLDKNPSLGHLKNILNLSFQYLPKYLKNCFLYCSLFPEDFSLPRKKLIRLWIAEGFIEEKGTSTLEEVAEDYLKELINRCMLQIAAKNYSGRVKRCKMHDTYRELAISLCKKENFGLLHEDNNSEIADGSTRRLSIINLRERVKHDVCLRKLRTFMSVHNNVPSSPLLSMIFDKSRYLTVVDLEGLPIETVPNAIGDLFNLHYLGLRKTKVKSLPKSIKKLQNLQTLDLLFSQIQTLPDGIAELKKLRHLFAEVVVDPTYRSLRTRTGISLPKGIFYLKDLQTIQAVESNALVVRELGNLTQLRSFRIWNVKENHSVELCKSLSKMSFLSYLSINASDEEEILQLEGLNLPKLRKLDLHGKLKKTMLESALFKISGDSIQMLHLAWSQLKKDPLPSLCHCRNLTCLHLKRAYEGQQLIFKAGWFPKLKKLVLKIMPNLIQVEMEQGTMVSLEQILLTKLEQLVDVPKGINHLGSLKWMGCTDMPVDFGRLSRGIHKLSHFRYGVRYSRRPTAVQGTGTINQSGALCFRRLLLCNE